MIKRITMSCILLIALPTMIYAALDPHTLAIWLFDEGTGDVVRDASGNGHDGKLIGGSWVEGNWNGALDFGGDVANYVEVPHDDSLTLEKWSIEAWLKMDNVPGGWNCPFTKEVPGANRNYALHIAGGSGAPHGSISLGNSWGHATLSTISIADGKWHHVAATYDGDNCILYVDGQKDSENSIGGPPDMNDGPITIGANVAEGYPFDGVVDEIRLSSKVRTVEEIVETMEKGLKSLAAVYPRRKLTATWASVKRR